MSAEDELWLAVTAEHEWLGELRGVLQTQDLTGARSWADALLLALPAGDYRRTYLGWLCAALAVPPKNETIGVGLEALAAPFLLAAPRLLCHFGIENPAELELVNLDETYRVILDACEPGDPIERIARGLRLFHSHLISAHGAKPLADPRSTFGEGGALMPVDATLIAVDEFLAAHDWLERELQYGADPVETLICQVVLTLTFRVGLRRGEVFGLRVCDIQDRGGLYLHVRRYPGHRLKTPNATRTVRIDALLTMRERALVRKWVATRKLGHDNLEEHELGQLRLLARPGAVEGPASVDGTVRRVMQAVHAVTKDARLVLHHLRHSAASWLWLKLRAPDYPELQRYTSSMPALCAELRWSRRLRVQLCGATDGPSRAYSNVVAKVLGHGVPLTSLEHYIHTADLFLAATTARTVKSLPVKVWEGLTDVSRSTVYGWLQRGPLGVVAGYRARLMLSNCENSTPARDNEGHVNPWRKRAAALAVRFRSDGDIGLVSRALHLYNRLDTDVPAMGRIHEVAQRCSLDVATIENWLNRARAAAPAFGMKAPEGKGQGFQAVPAPEVDLHRATAAALDDLSNKLGRASLEHPSLLCEALNIAAQRFNLRRNDVCFRGEKDEIAARRFLKALDLMGLLPHQVRLTVRRESTEDKKLPHWFRSARALDLAVKRLPPPGTSESQAKAYARWVGVQLCNTENAPAGHAWRIGLFLACIAYAPAQSA
jgi:integrase